MKMTLFWILLVVALLRSASVNAQQSTTGPVPPPGTDRGLLTLKSPSAPVVINGVPAYLWHHGCGPTAVGMILGYWDRTFTDIVPGDATTQTTWVNWMIADDSEFPTCMPYYADHYHDYSCPLDDGAGPILPDRSQSGGAHASQSVADFMRTSMSLYGNKYGWSWLSDISGGFTGYLANWWPFLSGTTTTFAYAQFSWASYKAEIAAGRPVTLLVDTQGDGTTDHFVAGVGYDDVGMLYGVYDTWDHNLHWYSWRGIGTGITWGVGYTTTFYVACSVVPPSPVIANPTVVCIGQQYCVSWGSVAYASYYEIKENTGAWSNIGNTTSRCFTKATPGTYTYWVRATSQCGTSVPSDGITVTVNGLPSRPQITDGPIDPCVTQQYCFSWGAVPGATSYEIQENSGGWADVGNVTQQCYTKAIGEGGFYVFSVRAKNNCGTGGSFALGFFVGDALAPPGALSISPNPGCVNQQYCISWGPISGASSYEIRENSGTWMNIGNVTQQCYTKSVGGAYCYDVRTIGGCVPGLPSGQVCVSVNDVPGTPGLTCTPGCGYIDLSWGAVSGATYCVYRDGNLEQCGMTTLSWRDNNPGTIQHCYTVSARSATGCEGTQSSPLCCTANAWPTTPPGLTCTPACGYIDLSWGAVSGATYCVYRDGILEQCGVATLSWRDNNPGTIQHCYTVSARSASGCEGAQSSPSCSVALGLSGTPGTPSIAVGCGYFDISWGVVQYASAYELYRDGIFVAVTNSTTYRDNDPIYENSCYQITAVNECGVSAPTSQLCANDACTHPRAIVVEPGRYARDVDPEAVLTVTFDSDLVPASFTADNVRVQGSCSGRHALITTYDSGSRRGTIICQEEFTPGEMIECVLTPGIESTIGTLFSGYSWKFSVATANTPGALGAPHTIACNGQQALVHADINRDGLVDIVGISYSSVDALINMGNGSSWQRVSNTVGGGSGDVGFFDNDSIPDIVVSNLSEILVFRGLSDGRFQLSSRKALAGFPGGICADDFDRDGRTDIAAFHNAIDPAGRGISILAGNGDGSLGTPRFYSISWLAWLSNRACAIDAEGDGDFDVATFDKSFNSLIFAQNNGKGFIGSHGSSGTALGVAAIRTADMNQDGLSDIILASGTARAITIHFNNGVSFSRSRSIALPTPPREIEIADLDGDGDFDIIVADSVNALYIIENRGSESFRVAATYSLARSVSSLTAADFDGDGDIDVAGAYATGDSAIIFKNLNCVDSDGDGYGDPGHPENTCLDDNCPSISNPDQRDTDGDGLGDACDPCTCAHQGDLVQNGVIDVSDVLKVIQIAFVNGADTQDPGCPRTRGDVNNSGLVDVNDVLYIIKTAFSNGPTPVNPCP